MCIRVRIRPRLGGPTQLCPAAPHPAVEEPALCVCFPSLLFLTRHPVRPVLFCLSNPQTHAGSDTGRGYRTPSKDRVTELTGENSRPWGKDYHLRTQIQKAPVGTTALTTADALKVGDAEAKGAAPIPNAVWTWKAVSLDEYEASTSGFQDPMGGQGVPPQDEAAKLGA